MCCDFQSFIYLFYIYFNVFIYFIFTFILIYLFFLGKNKKIKVVPKNFLTISFKLLTANLKLSLTKNRQIEI